MVKVHRKGCLAAEFDICEEAGVVSVNAKHAGPNLHHGRAWLR